MAFCECWCVHRVTHVSEQPLFRQKHAGRVHLKTVWQEKQFSLTPVWENQRGPALEVRGSRREKCQVFFFFMCSFVTQCLNYITLQNIKSIGIQTNDARAFLRANLLISVWFLVHFCSVKLTYPLISNLKQTFLGNYELEKCTKCKQNQI